VAVIPDKFGQYVLDPAEAKRLASPRQVDHAYLSEDVIDFGYLPDTKALQAGDLVLVSSVRFELVGWAIRRVQRKLGFAARHFRWHHAGVYIGRGAMCEATRKGVISVSLFNKYVGRHLLRFRRGKDVSTQKGLEVTVQAMMQLTYRYDSEAIVNLLIQAFRSSETIAGAPRSVSDRVTICSQLFADAYSTVTLQTIQNDFSKPVTPAALSLHADFLEDVPVEWVTIVK